MTYYTQEWAFFADLQINQLKCRIEQLERQLDVRSTVTDEMKQRAKNVAFKSGLLFQTGTDFDAIVGAMLSAALEAGVEESEALRERRRRQGIVEVAVYVPESRRKELKALARQWCDEHTGNSTKQDL